MSNATADSSSTRAYQDKLRGLLGERRPMEVLARTPDTLRALTLQRSVAMLRARPFPGKWTPNEILGHLLDAEMVFAYRTRTVLCDERPTLQPMNQDHWVAVQRHNEREPRELLDAHAALRAINLSLWRGLGDTELDRVGLHTERGEESLRLMLTMAAGHDLSHIDQITRYVSAIEQQR